MKIAVVYNRESKRVINLFGVPSREIYGLEAIERITRALKKGGHHVLALEGDKDLIDRLEKFMPQVLKGEYPGLVFNISYGIQGQGRYSHVPAMLEMLGLPYVGSGPLAHSLALDKVVSKIIFRQHDIPTPEFAVLNSPGDPLPDLAYPLVVKPKNEAVSLGLRIVRNKDELIGAANSIFTMFRQPVLVERYIGGREINVGILGNNPPQAFPPVEVRFGPGGPDIYTYEDKQRLSGREVTVECPAQLDDDSRQRAQELALKAFAKLGCYDCARVDMRLDEDGDFYVLELNSLPSLNATGSYVAGAAAVGLDFARLVNCLVEVASARYFGTPNPPAPSTRSASESARIISSLSRQRDNLETHLENWTMTRSRTSDRLAIQGAAFALDGDFKALGLRVREDLTDSRVVWTWETPAGLDGGTLLVGHLDVPLPADAPPQMYHKDPEWLYGEGIASSRAPLVACQFALRALRSVRRLRQLPLGVLYYADEGRDCHFSELYIRKAAARASSVLVLFPGNPENKIVTARRGLRQYRVTIEGEPLRLGIATTRETTVRWAFKRLEQCAQLTNRKDRIAVAIGDLKTTAMPLYVPHQLVATLLVTFPREEIGEQLDLKIRGILSDRQMKVNVQLLSNRTPMVERPSTNALAMDLRKVAEEWEIPLGSDHAVWPSVAGLVPASTAVLCGIGPVAVDLHTPREAVERISLVQRTLLLAEFLAKQRPGARTGKTVNASAGADGSLPDRFPATART